MNIGVNITSEFIFLFSSQKYSQGKLLYHIVVLFFICWSNSILLSMMTMPIYITTNSMWFSPLLLILINTCSCFLFFCNSHSDRSEMIFYCGFDLHFLDDYQRRISFHLFVVFEYLLWKNVHLGPMLILLLGCIIFYMLSLNRCLYILYINLLWDISFTNNFHSVGSIFISLFLLQLKDFSLIWFHLFIFASVFLAWGDRSRKQLLRFVSKSVLPKFSSRSFIISYLIVKSPFWACFCIWSQKLVQSD